MKNCFYRIQHIETGLFFCLSKKVKDKTFAEKFKRIKVNLSKSGKLYSKKPTVKQLLKWINFAGDLNGNPIRINENNVFQIWRIVEF